MPAWILDRLSAGRKWLEKRVNGEAKNDVLGKWSASRKEFCYFRIARHLHTIVQVPLPSNSVICRLTGDWAAKPNYLQGTFSILSAAPSIQTS